MTRLAEATFRRVREGCWFESAIRLFQKGVCEQCVCSRPDNSAVALGGRRSRQARRLIFQGPGADSSSMKGRMRVLVVENATYFPGTLPLFTKRLLIIVTRDLACTQTRARYKIIGCVQLGTILSLFLGPGLEPGEDEHQQSAALRSGPGSGWRGVKGKEAVALSRNQTHSPHRVKRFSNGITHIKDAATLQSNLDAAALRHPSVLRIHSEPNPVLCVRTGIHCSRTLVFESQMEGSEWRCVFSQHSCN